MLTAAISLITLLACPRLMAGDLQVKDLRTERIVYPEGIDVRNPGLSWEITGADRGIEQTGYQVLVSSTSEKLGNNDGDLWDSGKIQSAHEPFPVGQE